MNIGLVWLRFWKKYFFKNRSKSKNRKLFVFGYKRRYIFYHNQKLLNYLDATNVKVLFLIKLQLRSERMRIR